MTNQETEPHARPISQTHRIVANLADRHWSVFVLELALIVVGILVALAIDGWMNDYRDRRSETAYLELLNRDLGQIDEQLQNYIEFENTNMILGATAYRAISQRNSPDDAEKIGNLLSQMSSRLTFKLVSAAYTDLTSTGNLRLIKSRELRDHIVRYFAEAQRIELIIEKNNQVFVDGLYVPFLMDTGIAMRPDSEHSLRVLADSDKAVLRLLGSEYVPPEDAVLSLPPEADSWSYIRRHVLLRMRVAAIGREQAENIRSATKELQTALAQQLDKN